MMEKVFQSAIFFVKVRVQRLRMVMAAGSGMHEVEGKGSSRKFPHMTISNPRYWNGDGDGVRDDDGVVVAMVDGDG